MVWAYVLLWRFGTAVPLIDDYWHIFAFALDFTRSPTLNSRIHLLFSSQVGPYKLIFDHALIALQLLLIGHLDFPVLILIGNLTLIGILTLLWKHAVPESTAGVNRILLVLPVSLLLFSLNYAETVDWAISGIQQPMVVFFSLASLHFLVTAQEGTKRIVWASLFGVLASATYANGMLVWPVGLVYCLFSARSLKLFIVWCLVSVLTSFVYLAGYSSEGLVAHASLTQKFLFLVIFCGGALENMHHWPVPYISLPIGLGVLVLAADSVRTRFDIHNPFFFYSTFWILLTAAVVSNARIAMGLQLSLSSRYKIYCDLLLIFLYVYILQRFSAPQAGKRRSRTYFGVAVIAALAVNVAGDVAGAHFLRTRKIRAEDAMKRYLAQPTSASPMFLVEDVLSGSELKEEDKAREEMNEAIRLGIYTPPILR